MILPACQTAVCLLFYLSGAVEAATSGPHLTGYLSGYNEAPTVGTVAYRQEIGDIPQNLSGYDVLIATADCGQIGKVGTLYTVVGPLNALVFDCGGDDGGHHWMRVNNILAEIDWYTWVAHPELVGSAATLVMEGE